MNFLLVRSSWYFLVIWLLSFFCQSLSSQVNLVSEYRMDNCTGDDNVGTNDAFFFGPNACACGVQANGLDFDGNVNFLAFPQGTQDILSSDFTMSFYVRFDNQNSTTPIDVFSLSQGCRLDSMLAIRYLPSVNQIRVRISDSPQNFVDLSGELSTNSCWHFIALTKSGSVATLYINAQQTDQDAAISDLNLNIPAPLAIANSPCIDVVINPDARFRGRIDELRFYNGPLTQRQIQSIDFMPDRVTSSDTTIFIGESALLRTGGTCSDNFTWSPSQGLSDPNSLNPVASPTQSTTYTLTVEDSDCTVVEDVRINVVERDELTCADLSLPSAFTPNNDGVNDTYFISNGFLIDQLISFEVFNKWGGRVFYTNSISGGWNGIIKSESAPATSYVYRVKYTCQGEDLIKSGTVNLIR